VATGRSKIAACSSRAYDSDSIHYLTFGSVCASSVSSLDFAFACCVHHCRTSARLPLSQLAAHRFVTFSNASTKKTDNAWEQHHLHFIMISTNTLVLHTIHNTTLTLCLTFIVCNFNSVQIYKH